MLPVYLPAGTFPYSFFTFLPGCYAGEGGPSFSSPTPIEINNIRRNIFMNTPVSLMDDQMVDMAFITQLTGLTDKWFYKLIKDGAFPTPIKLGRSSRWLKSEVEAWLQARIAQSRP
ncbi:AlpA family transcriptional regulator [Escherichia coli]|nr:AlpA family transcriptional regulator [Escherichia coli]HAV8629725.1 AlpA family transcriptional regulator [Escherichia coli]HAW3387300.1 AlpA family transcriptional regulator [Escherichia coli]